MFQFPANPVINQLFSPIPGLTYQFNGTGWAPIRSQSIPLTVLDTQFTLQDNVDPTKQLQFDNSLITPGTTRVLQVPDSDGVIAVNSQLGSFRNKIIGGDFSTNPWQRGTNFPSISTTQYTADRWQYETTSASVWTAIKDAVAPTVAQAGRLVTHSLLLICNIADVTVGAGDVVDFTQYIEGYNFMPLAQRPMVLSFWHYHTKVGTYCVGFRNTAGDRSYVAEYTQTLSNTWEFTKIVVPPSPVAGTWNYTNGIGLIVTFTAMAGTNFHTTPGTWQTGNFFATANQVNAADAANNNFRFALVQLETGTAPTPFEDRSFGTELMLCQRYYQSFVSGLLGSGSIGVNHGQRVTFPVPMRTTPTLTASSLGNTNAGVTTQDTISDKGYRYFATLAATGSFEVISATTANAEF